MVLLRHPVLYDVRCSRLPARERHSIAVIQVIGRAARNKYRRRGARRQSQTHEGIPRHQCVILHSLWIVVESAGYANLLPSWIVDVGRGWKASWVDLQSDSHDSDFSKTGLIYVHSKSEYPKSRRPIDTFICRIVRA